MNAYNPLPTQNEATTMLQADRARRDSVRAIVNATYGSIDYDAWHRNHAVYQLIGRAATRYADLVVGTEPRMTDAHGYYEPDRLWRQMQHKSRWNAARRVANATLVERAKSRGRIVEVKIEHPVLSVIDDLLGNVHG